jgi:hypothetical protein
MCWSAEVSLNTFLMTSFAMFVLYILNYDTFHIALIFAFVLIQLVEYFMWIYINDKRRLRAVGFISFVVIFLQPIIILLFTKSSWIIPYYVLLQLIWFCFFVLFTDLKINFTPYVAKNKHLSWHWTHSQIYIYGFFAIYLTFWLGTIFYYAKPFVSILAILTFLFTLYNYNKYNTASSMWCWSVNLFVIFVVIDAVYQIYLSNISNKSNKPLNKIK